MRRRRTDWYGNLLDEHQRRELDDALALALNQVHEHRHDDRRPGRRRTAEQEMTSSAPSRASRGSRDS
jgi:hypothetical protein